MVRLIKQYFKDRKFKKFIRSNKTLINIPFINDFKISENILQNKKDN